MLQTSPSSADPKLSPSDDQDSGTTTSEPSALAAQPDSTAAATHSDHTMAVAGGAGRNDGQSIYAASASGSNGGSVHSSQSEQFLAQWKERAGQVETHLREHMLRWTAGGPSPLVDAIEYSLMAPGKRLRPLLALWAAEVVGGDYSVAFPSAVAVEMIHCYSLIHDDLPAMDDDDLRRGRPTCHIQFDESTAILAGDALQPMAFAVLAHSFQPTELAARACQLLSIAAGPLALVGGQADDLQAEKTNWSKSPEPLALAAQPNPTAPAYIPAVPAAGDAIADTPSDRQSKYAASAHGSKLSSHTPPEPLALAAQPDPTAPAYIPAVQATGDAIADTPSDRQSKYAASAHGSKLSTHTPPEPPALAAQPNPTATATLSEPITPAAGGAGGNDGQSIYAASASGSNGGSKETDAKSLLARIHARKTGAMIRVSLELGALAARATPEQMAAIGLYGQAIGQSFQIVDDLLDVQSTSEQLGKRAGKDEAAGKLTYPRLYGVPESILAAKDYTEKAIRALEMFGSRGEPLIRLAETILERTH